MTDEQEQAVIQQIRFLALSEFLSAKPHAVLLLYADWDGHERAIRPQLFSAAKAFTDVEFGQLCLSEESQATFGELDIRNVPAVAFFAAGQLQHVKYGTDYSIATELERILDKKTNQP